MPIVKVGNTAAEIGGNQYTGGAIARDTNYAQEEAQFDTNQGQGATADWGGLAGATDAWCHFRCKQSGGADGNFDGEFIHVFDTTGNLIFLIDALDGFFFAAVGPDGGATNPSNGATFDADLLMTLDIRIWNDGAAQRMDIYINGALGSQASYDTATAAQIDFFRFANLDMAGGVIGGDDFYFSELLVTDAVDTRGLRVATLDPNAAGFHDQFNGAIANLQDINDGGIIDADGVGEQQTWTLSAYNGPATPTSILAVATVTNSRRGVTGPQHLRHLLRTGGTTYDNGSDIDPLPDGEVHIWNTNPATALAWDVSALTGLEQGVEVAT